MAEILTMCYCSLYSSGLSILSAYRSSATKSSSETVVTVTSMGRAWSASGGSSLSGVLAVLFLQIVICEQQGVNKR